jgi:hypothetical protein
LQPLGFHPTTLHCRPATILNSPNRGPAGKVIHRQASDRQSPQKTVFQTHFGYGPDVAKAAIAALKTPFLSEPWRPRSADDIIFLPAGPNNFICQIGTCFPGEQHQLQ